MADVWANSMACHSRATCHCAECCHLVNSLSRFQSHMHATLQGAVTWRNQCQWQGVRIPSAILKIVFRHILYFFVVFNAVLTSGGFRIVSDTLVSRSFLTLNIMVTLKCELEITQGVKVNAVQKFGCDFHSPFIVTTAVSCIVCEILRLIGPKSRNFYTPSIFSALIRGDPIGISQSCLILIKLTKNYNMLSRFHTIPERNGQTDRQTDGRTDSLGQTEELYQYRDARQCVDAP